MKIEEFRAFEHLKHVLEFLRDILVDFKENVGTIERFGENDYFRGVVDGYDSALGLIETRLKVETECFKKKLEERDS